MATSIASQLQAIKASFRGREDPVRRPFTRPSVLFDPGEAADVDLRTLLPIAVSGLDVLVGLDARFCGYRDTLFSHTSLNVEREKMVPKEEEKLNKSVSLYLRLLSGYLQHPAALKTLEYMIRRYRVHILNMDDLLLCALPYHDTHAFVRIVQLLDLGNSKWRFLEGVKSSGAPPPRKIIVQQCIRDKGILEVLCNYASPTKEFQHSKVVVCFSTAVIIEALGSVHQLDSDTIKRVLPFIFSGLNPAMRGGRDNKAGALMVVGLVASRSALAPKLLNNLISFVAKMAEQDAKELADVPWLRMILMTVINLVQTQSPQLIPKKALKCLASIRDIAAVLKGLSQEFNIEKFLSIYLETLIVYSSSDAACCFTLTTLIETVPMKGFIDTITSKVLSFCMKWFRTMNTSDIPEAGSWVKQILMILYRNYPSELQAALHKFHEDSKVATEEGGDIMGALCLVVDRSLDLPLEISDPKIWFSLEHPNAVVRQAALSALSTSGVLDVKDTDAQKIISFQDAILRRLHDDDLSVVQSALSIDGLSGIISPSRLLKAFQDVLLRCIVLLNAGSSPIMSMACEVAVLCLERVVSNLYLPKLSYSREVATMLFPFLLVLPKTSRVNLKSLQLAKELQWPFYSDSFVSYDIPSIGETKNMEPSDAISLNQRTVRAFSETFVKNPKEYIQWLVECCNRFKPSKKLFLLILLKAVLIQKEDSDADSSNLLKLFQACHPVMKQEWQDLVAYDNSILSEEFTVEKLDKICYGFTNQLIVSSSEVVIANILVCIYWILLKALSASTQRDPSVVSGEWLCILEDLFVFFVTSSSKRAFEEHILFLMRNCSISPTQFLSKIFTSEGFSVAVQVQSLVCFATICSMCPVTERSHTNVNGPLQFLICFPSLLIPLSNENKDIRTAAMDCLQELYKLLQHLDISRVKNGNGSWSTFSLSASCFEEFLGLVISQKLLILSDADFLSSFFISILSSSQGLLVSQDINKRFDHQVKETFLNFFLRSGLDLSSYGKLRILTLFKGLGSSMLRVEEVKVLFFELLERRKQCNYDIDKRSSSSSILSQIEVQILCLLLETSLRASRPDSCTSDYVEKLVGPLKMDGVSLDDPAIVRPCIAILQNLTSTFYDSLETEMQDNLFANLVCLFRSDNADIRNTTREALSQINISSSTIAKHLEVVGSQGHQIATSSKMKRKKKSWLQAVFGHDISNRGEKIVCFLGSLLDILFLKKNIEKRESLVNPLFMLLGELFANDWIQGIIGEDEKQRGALPVVPATVSEAISYAQQTTLHILQDITASISSHLPVMDDLFNKCNIRLLVECARATKDVVTLNHVFSLLSSIAKVSSQWVSDHILELFSVIGESAAMQNDGHSQHILEELISTLVPCWLSTTNSIKNLLQVFVNVLPEVPENRRLTLMVYLLRTLGEKDSLGLLIALLFHVLVAREVKSSAHNIDELLSASITGKWEYIFATQICDQYSCRIWLPSLVVLFQDIGTDSEHELFSKLHLVMLFALQKLQDTEFIFAVQSGHDSDYLQGTLGELMEQVILQLKIIDSKGKELCVNRHVRKQLKESMLAVIKNITKSIVPSVFFKAIGRLMLYEDGSVKKKALGLLCQTVKDHSMAQKKDRGARKTKQDFTNNFLFMDESASESLGELCLKIIQLVDEPKDACPDAVKLAAISSLEVLSKELPTSSYVSPSCLSVLAKHITSDNMALSSSCLRSAGALITVLASKALSVLPFVMKQVLERAHDVSKCPTGIYNLMQARTLDGLALASGKSSILLSLLVVLEAIVENLGCLLNPYLECILDLVILHPEYTSESDQKLKMRASLLRKLITEKIPARLLLTPLMKIYKETLNCGEMSISLTLEMLANMVSLMDRSSIGSCHSKIYEQCFFALDLRRWRPEMVKNVDRVEDSAINALTVLSMKLTESMFRPLFIHSLDWADSESEASDSTKEGLHRKISFYKLVNKLTEQHRSLFVPYFKYLIEGCVHHLTDSQDVRTAALTKKRKKMKIVEDCSYVKGVLSREQWHLRALILMSLYKCFLYDTGNLKFLDSSNFQVLLKPIVSQLLVDPPVSLEPCGDLPNVNAVDESLVCCLGQMAVTVGTDDIWKQLNHEVLMQTRSEKIRARILALRVVKYLVEHLKEEYLICLPETIPFLSELLEDVEPPVKSLSQEILRELESLSGESLQQYL